jgi:hypothetical protein
MHPARTTPVHGPTDVHLTMARCISGHDRNAAACTTALLRCKMTAAAARSLPLVLLLPFGGHSADAGCHLPLAAVPPMLWWQALRRSCGQV